MDGSAGGLKVSDALNSTLERGKFIFFIKDCFAVIVKIPGGGSNKIQCVTATALFSSQSARRAPTAIEQRIEKSASQKEKNMVNKQDSSNAIKLDSLNQKILTTIQYNADISNNDLAALVGLSPAACSKRVTTLKQSGLLVGFHAEIDLDRLCEHVTAYVEFTLESNDPSTRKRFTESINDIPEFMDCLRLTGDVDYISFTCCRDIRALNELCDRISGDTELKVRKVSSRIIIERAKWFLGYPIDKLKWLHESETN